MKKIFLFCAAVAFSASSAFSQACEDFNDGPYINFNNLGGAPCSETPPATVEITTFEIWKSEAYLLSGVQAGASYTFSACNGVGGTAWDIDFTIVAPSGAVDAFGLNPGSICELDWTASEDGEYTLIVNEAGNCGATTNLQIDNGNPAVTYNGGGECAPPVTACEAGTLDVASIPSEICPEIAFNYSSTGVTIPNTPVVHEFVISFDAVPGSGSGGPFGTNPDPSFILTLGSPTAGAVNADVLVSIDNILTTAGGAPAMVGEWVLTGRVQDGFGNACDSVPPVTVDFLPAGTPGCDPPANCEAGSAASVDQTVCPGDDVVLELTGEDFESAADIQLVWVFIDTVTAEVFVFPLPSTSPATYNFTGDLNAELALAGLPTLAPGVYLSFAGVFDDLTGYCDFTEEASDFFLTILDENDPECSGPPPCELPYPAVDNASLSVVENPNGSVTFSWDPIEGQIGCQVNARVGDVQNPTVQTSIIVGGVNASSFTASPFALQNYQFTTLNFRVRCGCQQNPSVIAGPYSGFESIFYFGPSGITTQQSEVQKSVARTASLSPKGESDLSLSEALPAYVGKVSTFKPAMKDIDLPAVKAADRTSFDLYPNPSNGAVNLNYTAAAEGMVNVRVFDLVGKAVSDKSVSVNKGANFMNLDLSSLEKGVYIVEIMDNGVSSTAKVVLK